MSDLPQGWASVALGDLGHWQGGGTPSKSVDRFWRNGVVPWVSPKDMKTRVIHDSIDKLNEAAVSEGSAKLVPADSLLVVTRSGILRHSLPVAVTACDVAINQDLKALMPRAGINARFVAIQLRAYAGDILNAALKLGTTVESLDFARFKAFEIPLAPTAEQVRIVEKLEPLLARCDAIRAEVARVEKLTARRRRSALASAFRGGLIRGGRKTNAVPPGWRVVSLGSLLTAQPANGISPRPSPTAEGALTLRLSATTSGTLRLDSDTVKRVEFRPPPDSRYWLRTGDLLVQRANSLEHVGAAAIFEGEDLTYIYPDLMMRIRIDDRLLRRYVWRFLNSPEARLYFQERASGSAGNMPKITGAILTELPIPLPPKDEIEPIVDAIDRVLARLDIVERENRITADLVDRLEQAFLARASSGGLVRQDINDEPVGRMLEHSSATPHDAAADGQKTRARGRKPKVSGMETARAYVERQVDVWPTDGITFDQLRAEAPGSYEELKDAVFELLGGKVLAQRFDRRERKMKLVRVP